MYYVYMLRCMDESIYIGITNQLERRMTEHFSEDKKCAKYVRSHHAKKLEKYFIVDNKILASKLEYYLKKLNKKQKENIIMDSTYVKTYLQNKLNISDYLKEEFDE